MNQEVKFVSFSLDQDDFCAAEKKIAALINEGWVIVSAGGGGGGYGGDGPADGPPWGVIRATGFVILQRSRALDPEAIHSDR